MRFAQGGFAGAHAPGDLLAPGLGPSRRSQPLIEPLDAEGGGEGRQIRGQGGEQGAGVVFKAREIPAHALHAALELIAFFEGGGGEFPHIERRLGLNAGGLRRQADLRQGRPPALRPIGLLGGMARQIGFQLSDALADVVALARLRARFVPGGGEFL